MDNAVLVATGNPQAWRWVEELRTDPPIQVCYAREGASALREATQGGWQAVVLVDDLEGISGLSMLRVLRELYRELPVIFVAASAEPRLEVLVRRQGVHYYSVAPFSQEILGHVLRKLIEHETKKLFWRDGRVVREAR